MESFHLEWLQKLEKPKGFISPEYLTVFSIIRMLWKNILRKQQQQLLFLNMNRESSKTTSKLALVNTQRSLRDDNLLSIRNYENPRQVFTALLLLARSTLHLLLSP